MTRIHPTAVVERGAELDDDVEVEPYSIVGPDVRIRAGTQVAAHAVIRGRTTIGARNRIFQFTSIGGIPQDRKYTGEPTSLTIGDDNVIREFVSIHAGTSQDRGEPINRRETAFLWLENEYRPVIEMLRGADLIGTNTDAEAYMRVSAARYRLLRTHTWDDDVLAAVVDELSRKNRRRRRTDLSEP